MTEGTIEVAITTKPLRVETLRVEQTKNRNDVSLSCFSQCLLKYFKVLIFSKLNSYIDKV